MRKNYVNLKKALLRSGFMALGVFTLVGFNDVNPKKEKASAVMPAPSAEVYQVKVNFQNKAVVPPTGYLKDYGQQFGANSAATIGKTYNYGWKLASDKTPFDVSEDAANNNNGVGRNRLGAVYAAATPLQQLEGTLVHFQGDNVVGDGLLQWAGQPRGNEVYWELAVPNGIYEIKLSLGDKETTNIDSRHSATVEGYTIISAFVPTPGQTKMATLTVEVTDGLLTITGLGGFNSKINYIEVTEVPGGTVSTKGDLAFAPQNPKLNVSLGGTQPISSTLSGAGATDIGLVINDNFNKVDRSATGANDLFTLPTTASLGSIDVAINTAKISSAAYRTNTIIATAAGFKPASFDASVLVGCSPLSTVACDQIVKAIPVNLNFEGNDGGIVDASGQATGFTTATPLDGTRLPADPAAANISVNGVESSKLAVSGGNLVVTATKGFALGKINKQVNTLGVGLQGITTPIQLETRLIGINTGTEGSAQAGIQFGITQNVYIKLVVMNNSIELRKEQGDGESQAGENNADNIIVNDLGLAGKNVKLALVIDPITKKAAGFYAINDGAFILLIDGIRASLDVPPTTLEGRKVSDAITGVSLAGVFASYNEAPASFDATFDYFTATTATLSTEANELPVASNEIVVYPNPASSELNVQLGQDLNAVKSISIYDVQGRTVSTFEPSAVRKNNGFTLPTANLRSGIYFVQLQKENGDNHQIRFIANN